MKKPLVAAVLGVLLYASQAQAYVEISYTLGRVLNEATNIVVMKVEKVNKERRLIYYKKVADLKGKHDAEAIKHIITDGFHAREPKNILDWAEPGKTAIFFYQGGASETCIGDYWYQAYHQGEWWNMTHAEPFMAWAFSGPADKLKAVIPDMLAGKEVVIPCAQYDPAKIDEYKKLLHDKKCPLWRMKASLAIGDHAACMREKDKFVVGLGALGPEAVPAFIADLGKPDAGVRLKAAVELGQIGEDAKPALTALGTALQDADVEVRTRSAEALVRIDPKNTTAVPVLVAALSDEKLRAQTIDILGGLGEPAKPAVPALVGALQDKKVTVQLRAGEALLRIEPNSAAAINALIQLVGSPKGPAGWAVVEPADLKSTGGSTFAKQDDKSTLVGGNVPATDTYTMVLKSDRKMITAIKLEALADGSLPAGGPGRAPNGNYVLTRLAVAHGEGAAAKPVKFASAWADFGQQGFDVGNVAADNGTGWAVAPEFGKSRTAVFTLAAPIIGGDAGTVLTVGIECQSPHAQHQIGRFRLSVTDAEDPLLNPRVKGTEMLGGVGAGAKAAIPALMLLLSDPDVSLRQASASALSRMAPDSIPVLAAALKDPKLEVRLASIDSLSQAGGQAAPAIPALIDAWKTGEKSVRLRSGDLLAKFEGAAGEAAPALVASLADPDRDIRLKACEVLGRCGGAGRVAGIPVLTQLVAGSDKDLSARSAWVLGQIGPEAKPSVVTLTEATKHNERDVRLSSLEALDRVLGDPKALAPIAQGLLVDPDREIRIRSAYHYGRSNPFGGGPTVELFEDNHQLLFAQLTAEDGPAEADANDRFAGASSVKVMPSQRYNPEISGWAFPIAEKPELGEYRYIRFAWKKVGGNGIIIQFSTNTRGWENRYCAGKNAAGWAALQVDENAPGEWTVVTRDLFKDFGGAPFQLRGMALSPIDGTAGYFDHIYLGRSIEELDKVTAAKKKK
jgi:HEAT repeat protein